MASNKAEIIREVTMEVLDNMKISGQTYTPVDVADDVLEKVQTSLTLYNAVRVYREPDLQTARETLILMV